MPLPPPAEPGLPLDQVDTPALVVDLDAFERNLKTMAQAIPEGVRLRAHAKTHKSPEIALRQMALGAVGVCCQKVSEAEAMVAGGVGDVLVTNEIWGARKLARLAALAGQARVGVCVDDATNVADLAAAVAETGTELDVYVEIDVGAGRCGVAPGAEAVALAKAITEAPELRFAGLQAYQGSAQHVREHAKRQKIIDDVTGMVHETVALLAEAGLGCPQVTGAGTGTFEMEAASGVYTELQAGSYCFMDGDYAKNLGANGAPVCQFEHALFVLATVMSHRSETRAVIDGGTKAFNFDDGPPVCRDPAIRYVGKSDEHGVLEVPPGAVRLGEKLLFIPSHCDPTINLHDWYVCVRGLGENRPVVEAVWPVAARGAVF